jgi:hypothetical protein
LLSFFEDAANIVVAGTPAPVTAKPCRNLRLRITRLQLDSRLSVAAFVDRVRAISATLDLNFFTFAS